MSMRLTCPQCRSQFAAPANVQGGLVGCPVCKAVLNMPPVVEPAGPPDFWDHMARWGLIAAVLFVSFAGLMVDLLYLRTIVVSLISLAGALLGGLAWRTQLVENQPEGAKWRWLESNLGLIVAYTGLGLCSIHFMFFVYCLILFVKEVGWHEGIPPLLGALMLFLALNVGIAIGLHSLFERFGFYRAASCIYVGVAGLLPCLVVLVGISLGAETPQFSVRTFNPQAMLEPAARELARRNADKEAAPSVSRTSKRNTNRSQALPVDPLFPAAADFDVGIASAPGTPVDAPVQEAPPPAIATNDPPHAAPVEPAPAQPALPEPAPAVPVEVKPAMPVEVKPAVPVDLNPAEQPLRTNKPHILTVVEGRRIVVPSGKLIGPETRLTPGTEIQVEHQNQWNLGRVIEVLPDGDVRIVWLDSEKEAIEVVPRFRIRLDLAKNGPAKVEDPLEIAKTNRMWIDVKGNVIAARFVFCDGLVLRLRTTDGKVVAVPFEGLSISDQEVVREIVAAKMDEKAESQK